jgi:hypothetical protein
LLRQGLLHFFRTWLGSQLGNRPRQNDGLNCVSKLLAFQIEVK